MHGLDSGQQDNPSAQESSKGRIHTIFTGAALTLLLLLLGIKFPTITERLNNTVIDTQIGLLPKPDLHLLPIIVEVDEKSLAAYGQWPWPRYQVAHLLEAIQHAGATAIGVDALFVERDRTSPVEIQRLMERDLKQPFPLTAIKKPYWDYDTILGETIKTGSFILSYFFTFTEPHNNSCQPKSANSALLSQEGTKAPVEHLHHAINTICNVSPIQKQANASGFINSAPDNNGIYRKTPLVIDYKGRLYPSLALQTFLTANALDHFLIAPNKTGFTLQAGKIQIPLDNAGNLLIKFPAPEQSFEKISAYDVLSDNAYATLSLIHI